MLFVPKWPGEHIAPVEVYTQSLSPSLEPTTTILQLQAIAEIPNVEVFIQCCDFAFLFMMLSLAYVYTTRKFLIILFTNIIYVFVFLMNVHFIHR